MSSVESYTSIVALRAATANGTACLTGAAGVSEGAFFFTSADFTGAVDDVDIVKSDTVPISSGAWVRQTAASLTFRQSGIAATRRAASTKLLEASLSPQDFGAVGDGVTDDTSALQNMLNEAQSSGRPIFMPSGIYRIVDSLLIREEVHWIGAGASEDATVILNDIGDPAKAAINIYVGAGTSIIGLEIGHMLITTPGNYDDGWVRRGVGLYLETAYGNAIMQSRFHHLVVRNHSTGFHVGGRVYMCIFEGLLITSDVSALHGAVTAPLMGFRTGSFADITYNSFRNIEVTGVKNGGLAFAINSHFSDFTQLTMDGPAYFNGPGSTARNITCEAMTQTGDYPQTHVMNFTNFSRLDGIAIRDVPSSKFPVGVFIGGSGVDVSGIRIFNDGAGQPDTPIWLDGSGTIRSCRMVNNPAVNRMNLAALSGYVAIDMDDFTDYSISGAGAVRSQAVKLGFFGGAPIVKPTGVAANITAVHSALVDLGLIAS